jgi:glycosyltransferase involved in cell wall biosynthesis
MNINTLEKKRIAVFTIVSNNYLHFARTLMGSLRTVHPEWKQYVLLVDEVSNYIDHETEDFKVVEVSRIGLPDIKKFLFRYTILELNTAVKPWMFEWLFQKKGYDRVVYLDPDIYVYQRMSELEEMLESGVMMVLTPHLTGHLDNNHKPSELDILIAGSYNLGFLALARHKNLYSFLKWWQSKLEYQCIVDFQSGLFVDQKWIDLAPGMFGDFAILRHEGYNVAYWNLNHRKFEKVGKEILVNSQPLVFLHFSGMDPESPNSLSKHQDRFMLKDLPVFKELAFKYCKETIDNGLKICKNWRYSFGKFDDGTEIVDILRQCYRENEEIQVKAGDNPFQNSDCFNLPYVKTRKSQPIFSNLMQFIWKKRPDLQALFPEITYGNCLAFAHWFVNKGGEEYHLPEKFVLPVRKSLHEIGLSENMNSGDSFLSIVGRFITKLVDVLGPTIVMKFPEALREWIKAKISYQESMNFALKDSIRHQLCEATISRQMPFGLNYMGFYDEENLENSPRSLWMGKSAKIRLPSVEPGELRISGVYDAESHYKANKTFCTPVRVFLNDVSIGQFVLDADGFFTKTIEIPTIYCLSQAILILEPENFFVPSRIERTNDSRELSLRISKVSLNGEAILDFDIPNNPYVFYEDESSWKTGINIVGYVKSEHGLGESPRRSASAAKAIDMPFTVYDFNIGNSSRTEDETLSHKIRRDNPHLVNLIHINADQMSVFHSAVGQGFLEGHYNIGYWAWELPEFPDKWLSGFANLHEIWVPSTFILDSIATKSPVPVIRMPHAIGFDIGKPMTRKEMGLPEEMFLFLCMYDLSSIQARKNPQATIEAFSKAFPNLHNVRLIIKTQNSQFHPDALHELESLISDVPGIIHIDKTLTRREVYSLEYLCDCFVSLHRSEGFGLGLAESMFIGRPVIGTNWSGNTDFMNHKNSCPVDYELVELEKDYGPYEKGQFWAEADVDHASWYMKKLINQPEWRKHISGKGQKTIFSHFSPESVGKMFKKRLNLIYQWWRQGNTITE